MDEDEKHRLRETFDAIASSFDETRQEPWEDVEEFVEGREGALALDLGCGNGRHLDLLRERFSVAVGMDFSRAMLRICDGAVVRGDLCALPFRDGHADTVLCIAALHHLPSREERLAALDEIARVLRPSGDALVSVWAIEHPKFDGERDEIRASGGDVHVPWRRGDEERDRYYHIHEREEFESLVADSSLEGSVWESEGNYYARLHPRR
ncbi:MAG: methyltransferase domain-containing protein [Halobacteriales archaeon]|nr:methyltransferase domain-containing protein [Halobacteriales archaeon]